MELLLTRNPTGKKSTIGELSFRGRRVCYILEDVVREIPGVPVVEWKIRGATAIPVGRYEIIIDMSVRFGKLLPRLLEVEGFSGIRIHPGNTNEDTEGCLLPGSAVGNDNESVTGSRSAFEVLYTMLVHTIHDGERCFITVQ